jgi:predicted nucleic acid-binding protein
VIGGRVLDASAVMAFASQDSVYAAALVWTVVEEHMVLVLPSAAVAAAWSQLEEKYHPVLEVLLRLPNTVIDDLDEDRARAVGQLEPGDLEAAHAVACAQRRGWPLVTTDAARYKEFNVEVPAEELP